MRNLLLVALAVLVGCSAFVAHAQSVCVEADGGFVGAFALKTATVEEAEAAAKNITDEEQLRLKDVAIKMANIACSAELPFASSVKIYAMLDATVLEMKTLKVAWLTKKSDADRIVPLFAIGVRTGDPVVVRIYPVRMGTPTAMVLAVVTPGADRKKPPKSIEYHVAPWLAP